MEKPLQPLPQLPHKTGNAHRDRLEIEQFAEQLEAAAAAAPQCAEVLRLAAQIAREWSASSAELGRALLSALKAERALALGPAARKSLVKWHRQYFPKWRRIAKDEWNRQVTSHRSDTFVAIYTYDKMAAHIRDECKDRPTPSIALIRRAINGLRPTLTGRLRKNAAPKN